MAVRDAINKVESWAIDKTDREAKDITSQLREYYANEKNLDDLLDGKGNEAEEDENMFDEGDDDEDTEEHNSEDPSKESYGDNNGENPDKNKTESVSTESSLFNTALGHLRTLSSKLQTKDDSSVDDLLADLKNSSYVHDRKTSLNTMTLWSSANEVETLCFAFHQHLLIFFFISLGCSINMFKSTTHCQFERCYSKFPVYSRELQRGLYWNMLFCKQV